MKEIVQFPRADSAKISREYRDISVVLVPLERSIKFSSLYDLITNSTYGKYHGKYLIIYCLLFIYCLRE